MFAEIKRKSSYKGQINKIIGKLASRVRRLLVEEQWSPEQITGKGKLAGQKSLSHEAIYQFIYQDAQSGGCLHTHLRHRKKSVKNEQPSTKPGAKSKTGSASKCGRKRRS